MKAKNTNRLPIKRFIQGLAASWLAPLAPKMTARIMPNIENVEIIPNA